MENLTNSEVSEMTNAEGNMTENQDPKVQEQKGKKKYWKGILGSILVLIIFIAIQLAVSFGGSVILMAQSVAQAGGDAERGTEIYFDTVQNSGFMTTLLCVATVICCIVAVLWYKLGYVKKYTMKKREAFRKNVLQGKVLVTLTLSAICCYIVALLLACLVAWIVPSSMDQFNELMGTALGGNVIVAFLTVVIIGPIAEECMVRGVIFQMLTKYLPVTAAIIIQALIFSIYHMNIMQAIYVFPFGLALGYAAYKCKSVLPCIFMHVINNFMSLAVSALPEVLQSEVVFVVVLIICLLVLYLMWKKQDKRESA